MGKRIIWSEVGGVAEAIAKGEHDDDLEYIQIAAQARMKRMFRPRQRIRLKNTESVELDGQEGRIEKPNQKSISIILDNGLTYTVPPRMLELI